MPRLGFSPSRVAPVGATSRWYLPREPAAAERRPGQQPDAGVEAGRHDLVLDVAHEQVVLRLQRHRRREAVRLRDVHRLGDLPAEEVREAVVGDLAGA